MSDGEERREKGDGPAPVAGAAATAGLRAETFVFSAASESEGLIMRANAALLRLCGVTLPDVLGQPAHILFDGEHSRALLSQMQAKALEGETASDQMILRVASGPPLACTVSATEVFTDSGVEILFILAPHAAEAVVSEDMMDDRIRYLLEGVANVGAMMLDTEGHVTSWNQGCESLSGFSACDVLGMHFSQLFTDETPATAKDMLIVAERSGRFDAELWQIRKDGTRFLAHWILDSMWDADDVLIGFAGVAHDITERQKVRDAERANNAKSQFLASMSHEIRTPLNAIIGYTEGLIDEPLEPHQRVYVERIKTSGLALLTIINDILDLSKIEADRVEIENRPFDIRALTDGVAAILRGSAEGKGLAFHTDIHADVPTVLIGDESRIRQILLNLLNNAVKFTSAGYVKLDVGTDGRTDGTVSLAISVTDTGIGIPASKHHLLFQRFSQVDASTRREFGGTGLGLAISERLARLMGGTLSVDSASGKGSTFYLRLPLQIAHELDMRPPSEVQAEPAGMSARILLAEDLEVNQQVATFILERAGHTVDVAGDGAAALAMFQAGSYDLILMDIQMPLLDGVEATRLIRSSDHPRRDIPIIAMTANVMSDQIGNFIAAGMSDHVGKPIKKDLLLQKIQHWVAAPPDGGFQDQPRSAQPAASFQRPDLEEFIATLGGERALAWVEHLSDMLETAFSSDDVAPAALSAKAHVMISQAGTIGFAGLAQRCSVLERAIAAGGTYAQELADTREETQRVMSALPSLRKELAARVVPRD